MRARVRARTEQVPDTVEGLVANEFVRPTQRGIHQSVRIEHDGVGRGCPLNESLRAQRLDFVHEAEGARR